MQLPIFDEARHQYFHPATGARLIGVTESLQLCGLVDDRWYQEQHSARGVLVHAATVEMDQARGNGHIVDGAGRLTAVRGYLDAYEQFLHDTRFEALSEFTEHRMWHQQWLYAGTMDRVGRWRGDGRLVVVDIKTGAPLPSIALQLAGYQLLVRQVLDGPTDRVSVHLKENGSYAVHQWTDERDTGVFLSTIALARWILEHRLPHVVSTFTGMKGE